MVTRLFLVMAAYLLITTTAWADEQPFSDCPTCPVMRWLPDENIAMAITETSRAQWLACVADGACSEKPVRWPEPHMPMTHVLPVDAEGFCQWLSRKTGHPYRLPSEAEWQFAALAGTNSRFPWGDRMEPGKAVCQHCDPRFDHRPAPVATMEPNPWGLYDMNGNVWEWTADCVPPHDPSCRQRVIKGGSWYFVAHQSASTSRSVQDSREWSYDVGFRVVRER